MNVLRRKNGSQSIVSTEINYVFMIRLVRWCSDLLLQQASPWRSKFSGLILSMSQTSLMLWTSLSYRVAESTMTLIDVGLDGSSKEWGLAFYQHIPSRIYALPTNLAPFVS